MNICFICDLHLGYNKNTVQYEAFDYACADISRKHPDLVVCAGDITSDGNIFAAKRFIKKIHALGIPFVILPGNSDYRTEKNIPFIKQLASPCVNRFENLTVFAVNDASGKISPETYNLINDAKQGDIIVMHHPADSLAESERERFKTWRSAHPDTLVFYGHLHKSGISGNDYSLPALDPDKAIGENPSFLYFNTETKQSEKVYFFCPMPSDLPKYIGIFCFDPLADIDFAAQNGLRCIELRPNCLDLPQEELLSHILNWRRNGGNNLAMHAPEVGFAGGLTADTEKWDAFVKLAMYLGADRVTLHVPAASLETIRKNREALERIVDFLARRFAMLPNKCIVGVENMHMTSKERPDTTRRFGYLPEECVAFMKRLQERCPRAIGLNLDIGHARNNLPYQEKYPLGTWYAETGRFAIGYHLHQVIRTPDGLENHTAFTEPYGALISLASFFRCWNMGVLNKAPVIFEIRGHGAYEPSIRMVERESTRKVFDLHTHTLYSACGIDRPEKVISTAIENGIKLLGITDHSYGIGDRKAGYIKKIRELSPKYIDRIRVLCGIEIPTTPNLFDIQNPDEIADCDYALIEHVSNKESLSYDDPIGFCKKLKIRCGIAHTDLFAYAAERGLDPLGFFKQLAEAGIFWEMNLSYDSVHKFRKHAYVDDFLNDEKKQKIVLESGLYIGIGSDCHRKDEYPAARLYEMYDFLVQKGFPTADRYFL